MPKSKRNKQIELSKTKKRGLEWKKGLFGEVRSCVDSYANVFVFSVNDMRNSKMKTVREQWKHSRFFIGKNKIMQMALGRSAEEEYKPNLHKIGEEIKGQRGLLFSNKSTEEVLSWFRSYSEGDYARSGNVATEDVKLQEGPLPMFPHSLEPYLRQLGLPTSLVKGEIHLVKDHEVCKAGDSLTPESAKILKLLGYEMAEFHITIECVWSHDGSFMKLTDNIATDSKKNVKKEKKKKKSINKKPAAVVESLDEEMEVESEKDIEEITNSDHEDVEEITNGDHEDIEEIANDDQEDIEEITNGDQEDIEEITNDDQEDIEEITNNDQEDIEEITNNDQEDIEEVTNDDQEEIEDTEETPSNAISSTPVTVTSTPKAQNESFVVGNGVPEKNTEDVAVVDNQASEEVKKDKSSAVSTRPHTKKTRKSLAMKRDSLLKTPDANTSQDSPVFRQLRNRSVKVNRKRK